MTLVYKCVSMLVLAVGTCIIGLSTLSLRKTLRKNLEDQKPKQIIVITLLCCLLSGGLLATSLLQILPDMKQGLVEAEETLGIHWLAELVVCAGFFLGYIMEEVILMTTGSEHDECAGVKQEQSDMEMSDPDYSNTKYNPKYEVRLSMSTNDMFPTYHSPESEDTKDQDVKKSEIDSTTKPKTETSSVLAATVRVVIKVSAVSIYFVFEGLAAGKVEDLKEIRPILAVISIRQVIYTFLLLLELHMVASMMVFFLYLTIMTMSSPSGIGLGMLLIFLSSDEEHSQLVFAVVQGLTGGTILYTALCQLLRDRRVEVAAWLQPGAAILGFVIIMGIQILADQSCTSVDSLEQNMTLPHPYIVLGGGDVVHQVVPLEDAEQHLHPGHVHLEDNSLVYALVNRTAGFG